MALLVRSAYQHSRRPALNSVIAPSYREAAGPTQLVHPPTRREADMPKRRPRCEGTRAKREEAEEEKGEDQDRMPARNEPAGRQPVVEPLGRVMSVRHKAARSSEFRRSPRRRLASMTFWAEAESGAGRVRGRHGCHCRRGPGGGTQMTPGHHRGRHGAARHERLRHVSAAAVGPAPEGGSHCGGDGLVYAAAHAKGGGRRL